MTKSFLFLILTIASTLPACGGAPFEAAPREIISGAASSAGEAGAEAEAPGGSAGAGAAGGSAGSAMVTTGGAAGNAGAPAAGAAGASVAGSGGAAGSQAATPTCDSPKDAAGGMSGPLGTTASCLRTTEPLDFVGCSNWDDARTVTVNGMLAACYTQMHFPAPIGGYNYLEISAGENPKASINWAVTSASAP